MRATAIDRPDLTTDPRFSDAKKQAANAAQLRAILNDAFSRQPMQHWREVFDKAHITYGAIVEPSEVVNDPQLRADDMVVPLEGAGGKLTLTVSSPMLVHGVAKEPARRAPGLGAHNHEISGSSASTLRRSKSSTSPAPYREADGFEHDGQKSSSRVQSRPRM